MGNHLSACFPTKSRSEAKLIDIQGKLRRIRAPVAAADLMLQSPGHMVSPAEELRRTMRIRGMRAEEELRGGEVYFLFPLSRLNSRLSDAEMARLDTRKKKDGSGFRVFPVVGNESGMVRVFSKRNGEEGEENGDTDMLFHERFNLSPQWRPQLETINE